MGRTSTSIIKSSKPLKIIYVLVFVLIGLGASISLNFAAKNNLDFNYLVFIYFLVLGLNVARFLYWGLLLKKFDLSKLYPLTALFFPLIYLYSIYNGEAILSPNKVIGVSIIILGIFIFERKSIA